MATVDQRVVEMKFDNAQFEQGVKQTISSLEQLKTALNLNTATTGLSALQSSFDSFKLDNIQNSVDTLTNKFSTLGIVGMTAVQNITNKVIDFASNKVSSAFNQIVTGGWSRASNIAQSRFTLKGLFGDEMYDVANGITKVEEAFNNASDAVDGTAYSLDSAVSVASQLSASGVEVGEQMSQVLKSISGVAAMTGDTYDGIGNIYTTVAGNGRLMGMQLTQLSTHGLNAAATIADYLGKTESEVREMVSDGEISFQTFSDAMYDAFGEHAKDANKTFSGSMDNIRSALSRIGAIFSSGIIENDDLINFLNDVRVSINNIKKAIEPLEEPFKNLISTMSKVASGIVKSLDVTGFGKFIEYVAVGMDALSKWFEQFVKVEETIGNIIGISDYEFAKSGQAISSAIQQATDFYNLLDDTQKALVDKAWDIWMGDYGNGSDRVAALGDEYEELQSIVDQTSGSINSFSDFCEACYYILNKQAEATKDVGDETDELAAKIENADSVMDAIFIAADGVKTIFSSVVNVFKALKKSFTKIFTKNGFISDLALVSGMFTGLVKTFEITEERSDKLAIIFEAVFSVVAMLKDIILSLVAGISRKLNPAVSNLYDGLLDVMVAIAKVILKVTTFVRENETLHSVLEFLGNIIFGTASKVKYFFEQFMQLDAVQKIKDKLKSVGDYVGDKLSPIFDTAQGYIGQFFDKMSGSDTEGVDSLLESVNSALETFISLCENAWSKVDDFTSKMVGVKEALADFGVTADTLNTGVETVEKFTKTVKESDSAMSFFDNLTSKFSGLSTVVESVGEGINTFVSSISDSIGKILVAGFGAVMISLTMRLSNFVKALTGFVSSIASVPKAVGSSIKMVGEGIKKYFVNKSKAELVKNYAIAIGVLAVALIALAMVPEEGLYRALLAMSAMIVLFGTFVAVLTAMPKNAKLDQLQAMKTKIDSLSTMLLAFAASILILSLALVALTNEVNWNNIKQGGIALGAMLVAMIATVAILSKFASLSPGSLSISAFAIIAIAGGVYLLAKALEALTNLQIEGIEERVKVLGAIVLMMIGLLAISSVAKFSGALSLIAMIGAIWAIELTLKWVINNGVTSKDIIKAQDNIAMLMYSLILIALACALAGKNAKVGTALTILAFVYALITLTKIIITLTNMDYDACQAALFIILEMVGIIALLFIAVNHTKKGALSASVSLVVIAIAMMAMVGVMKLVGLLTPYEIITGIAVIGALTMFFSFLYIASMFAAKVKASTIWAMTGAIAAVVVLMTLMSFAVKEDVVSLLAATGMIGALLISLGLSLYLAGKYGDKIKVKSLIAMMAALAIAAAAVYLISSIGMPLSIVAAGAALGIILLALSKSLSDLSANLKKNKLDTKSLIYMGEFILLLVGIGAALGLVVAATSKTTTDKAVIAIAGVALVTAELVYLMIYLSKNMKGTSTTINRLILLAEMIVMVVFVAAAISMLTTAIGGSNISAAIAATISIGIIMVILVELTKTIANIKANGFTVKKLVAIGEMILMLITIAAAISMVVRAMSGASTGAIVGTIAGLILVLVAIAGFLAIVATIRTFTIGQLAALIIMIFMLKSVSDALVSVLLTGVDWKKMIAAAVSLGIVLLSISAALAVLTAIGSTGIGIVAMLAGALAIAVVLLAISEAVKIFASAMALMVECVAKLAEINYDNINIGKLTALVVIMTVVSVIAVALVAVLGVLSPLVLLVALNALIFAAAFAIVATNATNFIVAVTNLISTVSSFLTLIDSMGDRLDTIKSNIEELGTSMGTAFANLIASFVITMADNIESLKESVKTIMITIATAIAETSGAFAAAGIIMIFSFVNSFISTLNDYLPEIIESLADLVVTALNSLSKTIYNHADEIQDAVQTFLDVMTVKIKESDSIFSYMINDTDYLAAKLRLTDKAEELGEDTSTAMQEGADSTGGLDLSGKLDNEENQDALDTESTSITDTLVNKLQDKFDNSDLDMSSFTSFDVSDMEITGFGDAFGDLDLTDTSQYSDMITDFTNGSTEDFGNAGADSAEAYFNEYESGMSAYEFAKYGAPEDEDVIDTQEEAGALGGSTYYDSYVEEVNNQNGSEVVDGIVNWTTNEEAVATLKSGGEEGATNYIEGFKQGIYNMSASLKQAVVDAINGNVVDATAEATDSHSPSKKGYKFGRWWDMGFAGGVIENSYLMSDAITESFSGLDSDMESSLAHINAIVNNALDYEPTITPVLDTSNISEQAGWLDQTLDGQYSMSLAAQNQLEIDHANESSLARQIEDLRSSVQALANKDYSKILEGVNINVDASTNVDGKPLYTRASKHTIQVIDDQERSYIRAKGGRV